MKVGLCFLPSWLPYAPPLGLASLSACLKAKDHEVEVFDLNAEIYSKVEKEFQHLWNTEHGKKWMESESFKEEILPIINPSLIKAAKTLAFSNLDIIGISIYSSTYLASKTLIRLIRKLNPNIPIFYGGPGLNNELIESDLKNGLVNGAVLGEGEQAIHDIMAYLLGHRRLEDCKGIMVFGPDGEVRKTQDYPLIKLKDLPPPDFQGFDLSLYFSKTLPIEFSRGRVASCTFCSETNYWVSFRTKTVDQIIGEIKHNWETYGVRHYRVVDSLMNGNIKFLIHLAERIIEEKLDIDWYGFCRIDPKLTKEVLALLKKAGCSAIIFGLESGSQKVLDLMKKKVKMKDQYQIVKDTHESGIRVFGEILVGFPGEGLLDYLQTLKMLWVLRDHISVISTGASMTVVHRSEVYDHPERFGVVMKEDGWYSDQGRNSPKRREFLFNLTNKYVDLLGYDTQG